MKIGILTHHYVKNYGAFLQMKAMYETTKKMYPNAEVVIINYVNKKHWTKNILHVLHYRRKIDTLTTYQKKIRQLFTFTKYEKSIPRTSSVKNADEINACHFDMIILGSDEIWNMLGSGHNPMKFGYGLNNSKTQIIAYAPSVGSVTAETEIQEEVKIGINLLHKVSGRDEETMSLLERCGRQDAVKLLDPTFLYNFDVNIEQEVSKQKRPPYILIYDCKLTDEQVKDLRKYADSNNLKILGAGDYKEYYDDVTINLTPYEWINLFREAEKVVTGTFHGTVFSIKYDKDFVCYPTEKNRINKITSLLKDMTLSQRLLPLGQEKALISLLETPVDYEKAHKYIEEKILAAESFLLK